MGLVRLLTWKGARRNGWAVMCALCCGAPQGHFVARFARSGVHENRAFDVRSAAAINASRERVDILAGYVATAEAIAAVGGGMHEHCVLCKSTPYAADLQRRLDEQQQMVDAVTGTKPGVVPHYSDGRQLSL